MGSVQNAPSIESLFESVSLQSNGKALGDVLHNKLARGKLLDTLRQLTLALEQPEDIVGRVVFSVRAPNIPAQRHELISSEAFDVHVCESCH